MSVDREDSEQRDKRPSAGPVDPFEELLLQTLFGNRDSSTSAGAEVLNHKVARGDNLPVLENPANDVAGERGNPEPEQPPAFAERPPIADAKQTIQDQQHDPVAPNQSEQRDVQLVASEAASVPADLYEDLLSRYERALVFAGQLQEKSKQQLLLQEKNEELGRQVDQLKQQVSVEENYVSILENALRKLGIIKE